MDCSEKACMHDISWKTPHVHHPQHELTAHFPQISNIVAMACLCSEVFVIHTSKCAKFFSDKNSHLKLAHIGPCWYLFWTVDFALQHKRHRAIFISIFIDIERWKNNEQECLVHTTKVAEYAKQFKLGHCVSVDQDKKSMGSLVLEQTERSMGPHCQTNDTHI